MTKSLYIHTFGCQMNASDSDRMRELLARDSWVTVDSAAEADLILLNTCAIREKAEQKLFSALGRYRDEKTARGALLGVAGCVAQQEKGRILERAPYVDFVLGPDNLAALPAIVRQVETERKSVVETAWMDASRYVFPRADAAAARGRATAFVTAMKGCDNVCAFCVVPRTRGRELSRPSSEIVAEVASLVDAGVREVTLIGQNVNSFSGGCSFPDLLREVAAVPALQRLRFTTSHPHDFSPALARCYAPAPLGEPKLMPHLHLPVQSGSDAVLARMRRDYTAADFEARIEGLRVLSPDVALTSDVIVGFPGETEADFEATLALVERVGFDNLFSFLYSSRPHTLARRMEGEWGVVPEPVKLVRLQTLQALQRRVAVARMAESVGTTAEVLVEGFSRTDPARLCGHTPENRMVNFTGTAPIGALCRVRIEGSTASALAGRQLDQLTEPPRFTASPGGNPARWGLPVVTA